MVDSARTPDAVERNEAKEFDRNRGQVFGVGPPTLDPRTKGSGGCHASLGLSLSPPCGNLTLRLIVRKRGNRAILPKKDGCVAQSASRTK